MFSGTSSKGTWDILSASSFPDIPNDAPPLSANGPNCDFVLPGGLIMKEGEERQQYDRNKVKPLAGHSTKRARREISKDQPEPGPTGETQSTSRKRGRPKVDTGDETATERRRTQIRLAQRAYRQRKETAISSLGGRVSELESTIERMNKAFLSFQDEAFKSGVLASNPHLAKQLRRATKEFLELASERSDDSEHSAGADKASEAEDKGATAPQDDFIHTSDISRSADQSQGYPGAIDAFTDDALIQNDCTIHHHGAPDTVELANSYPTAKDTQYTIVDATPYRAPSGIAEYTEAWMTLPGLNVPQLFNSNMRITYSFKETTFARRLHRRCLELGYTVLRDPRTNPLMLHHKFRFTFGIANRNRLIRAFAYLTQKKVGESLEFWNKPFFYFGRAGMHYPCKDDYGNVIFPPNMHPPEMAMGPLPFHLAERPHNHKSVDDMVDAIGFGGDWFDCNDIEGYLKDKGIHVASDSTTVDVPQQYLNSRGQTPASSSGNVPRDANDTPGTMVSHQSRPMSNSPTGRPRYSQPLYQPCISQLPPYPRQSGVSAEPVGFLGLVPHQSISGRRPSFGFGSQTSNDQNSASSACHSTGRRVLDADKFINKIAAYSFCLGRAPGFRQRDVDKAVMASLLEPAVTKSDNLCKMIHKSKSSQLTAKKVTHTFPSDLFLEDGSWDPNTKRAHCARSRPLRERMGIMGRVEDSEPREFSKEEMSCLEDLLRGMMVYEPTERMTTKNAIASEWMRKYVPTSGSQAG